MFFHLPFLRGRGACHAIAAHGDKLKAQAGTGGPFPIPSIFSGIHLPADHYMHRDAPTEWWWNIGTLTAADGRTFGFEINAVAYQDRGFGFTQIMLTDVAAQAHYQRSTIYVPPYGVDFDTWAQSDPTRDWHVGLGRIDNRLSTIDVLTGGSGYDATATVDITGGGGSQAIAWPVLDDNGAVTSIQLTNPGRGYTSLPTVTINGHGKGSGATAQAVHTYVTMDAAWPDPTQNIAIVALLNDQWTGQEILFDLMLSQKGPPFLVWGTGRAPIRPAASGLPLQTSNFYYSLTDLHASGTITLGGETIAVTGVTWMDHEYGFFGSSGSPVKWLLQDAQLTNGWTLSNFCIVTGEPPPPYPAPAPPIEAVKSFVSLRGPLGEMYVAESTMTPGNYWHSPHTNIWYALQFTVQIGDFATLVFDALVPDQEFVMQSGSIYEGVAGVTGTFDGQPITGSGNHGWIEQAG
jgi:predicted secreted hydrolase